MSIHLTSILTSQLIVLLSAGMISGIHFFHKSTVSRREVFFFLICNFFLLVRSLVPIEFPLTRTIACKKVLPFVSEVFRYSIPVYRISVSVWQILLLLWILGAIFRMSVILFRYQSFQKLLKQMPSSTRRIHQRILDLLNAEQRKKTSFRIIVSGNFSVPMITGLLHPVILLPEIDFTEDDLKYILNHETNHYYFHDLWLLLATELITCVYWWNPLFYYIKGCIRSGLELRNDYSIAGQLSEQERLQYLECIVKIKKRCRKSNQKTVALNLCLGGNERLIHTRYEILLHGISVRQKSPKIYPAILAVIFVSFFIILEPSSPPKDVPDSFSENFNDICLVKDGNHYKVYVDGICQGNLSEVIDDFKNLPIYDSEEDMPK